MTPDDKRHGTNAGHVAGCRDDCCRVAHNAYRRSLWRKRYAQRVARLYVDATPTHRRLHALQALGWRYIDIDREMGHLTSDPGSTRTHNYVHQSRIHLDNARLVAEVYDRLCMTLGPSARLRTLAIKKGWAPPLAWSDSTLDDPRGFPRWDWVPCAEPGCKETVEARGRCLQHYRRAVRINLPKRTRTIEERLAAYTDKIPQGGCWIWIGALNQYGYGSMRGPTGTVATHRFVYERERGPIPEALDLDHLCRVRSCCNPDHLEPVTRQENVNRGDGAKSDLCRNGHPFDLLAGARKERRCSTCEREKRRARTERERRERNRVDESRVFRILAGDFALAEEANNAERRAVVAAWSSTLRDLADYTGWKVERYSDRAEAS